MSLYFFLYLQEKIYDSLWVISITRGYYRKESAALDPQANTETSDAKFERPETGRLPEVVPRG
jgi:hypothetical protein